MKKILLGVLCAVLLPNLASAHEVYVLKPHEIQAALSLSSFNEFAIIAHYWPLFIRWALIVIVSVALIFWISRLKSLTNALGPLMNKAKYFGPLIARITIGVSFLACAWYQAVFGPELPIATTFGKFSGLITVVLTIIGIFIIAGIYSRWSALAALVIFSIMVWNYHSYMLTYVNYLGEIIVLLILGAHNFSIESYLAKKHGPAKPKRGFGLTMQKLGAWLAPRSFLILRILFGIALIYASAYAKILHNYLALDTVNDYHLDKLLGFEPHFLVVGAALIELLIGIFFILGFEIRFTAVFLLFWLTLSLIFFGEVVWPHLILIGIPIAYIFYGYDRYSVGRWLTKNDKYEPVF